VQLRGTKAGQHRELERLHVVWALHHGEPFFASATEKHVDHIPHRGRDNDESATNRPTVSWRFGPPRRPSGRRNQITLRGLEQQQALTSVKALVRARARTAEGSEKPLIIRRFSGVVAGRSTRSARGPHTSSSSNSNVTASPTAKSLNDVPSRTSLW
jgi:hypothetical protein